MTSKPHAVIRPEFGQRGRVFDMVAPVLVNVVPGPNEIASANPTAIAGPGNQTRGGHAYADIVRKSDKPIRIYLQDGRNDNRGVGRGGNYDPLRDWFLQNVRLKDALVEKGYDVAYQWGSGRHSHKHGGSIVPDLMRWLWRDHPASTVPNDAVERSFNTPKRAGG